MFQLTAARRRLAVLAGHFFERIRFNSQPPEGGWVVIVPKLVHSCCFNSQPPEGGWRYVRCQIFDGIKFQLTAARRRLAVQYIILYIAPHVSTHSRPKAAGPLSTPPSRCGGVSTHSRPKAAGHFITDGKGRLIVSTHSRPKAAG